MLGSISVAVGRVLDGTPAGGAVSVLQPGHGLVGLPKKDAFQNAAYSPLTTGTALSISRSAMLLFEFVESAESVALNFMV
jgi:hypothetical protein